MLSLINLSHVNTRFSRKNGHRKNDYRRAALPAGETGVFGYKLLPRSAVKNEAVGKRSSLGNRRIEAVGEGSPRMQVSSRQKFTDANEFGKECVEFYRNSDSTYAENDVSALDMPS